jgi:hypothetical protein
MPGTTAAGTPYAEPADPLVQWPATSQQVAEAIDRRAPMSWVDARLSNKSVNCFMSSTNESGDGSLLWPAGFFHPGASPLDAGLIVMVQVYGNANMDVAKGGYFATLVSADGNGCTFAVGKMDGGAFVGAALPVMVIAIGVPA